MKLSLWGIYYLNTGLAIVGGIFLVMASALQNFFLGACGFMAMIACVLIGFVFLRCPNCGKGLNYRGISPLITKHCPKCGQEIPWDEKK